MGFGRFQTSMENTTKRIQIYSIFADKSMIFANMVHQFYNLERPVGLIIDNRKCWIATALGIAGSVASSLIGGAAATRAAKKAAKERTYRANAEKAWYDKAYNTDYMDTKAGQNMLRRAQEIQDEYVRKADGAAAVGGGTAAATAQAKEAANRTMGDTIANIAAQDTARKQHVEDQHQANVSQLSREREDAENQRAANATNAAQNASNALMNAAGSLEGNANKQKTNALGGDGSLKGNTNVTSVSDGASFRADDNGLLNPAAKGKTMLDDAVGDLMKRKPNVPHVGV